MIYIRIGRPRIPTMREQYEFPILLCHYDQERPRPRKVIASAVGFLPLEAKDWTQEKIRIKIESIVFSAKAAWRKAILEAPLSNPEEMKL